MRTRILFLVLTLLGLVSTAEAKLRLPAIFGDHMVLQQKRPLAVWGWAGAGQAVTVSLAGKTKTALAGPDGKWKVTLLPLKAGGPYDMVVAGGGSVTVQDVLVGEVWVASGQSNMELPLDNTNNAAAEIAKAGDGRLRWFVQDRSLSGKPLEEPHGTWKICTPGTAKDFSAAAYYFGKKLRHSLGVPVGIVGTYWGGTWIESWIPQETFGKDPTVKANWDRWETLSPAEKQLREGLGESQLQIYNLRLIPRDSSQKPVTILFGPDTRSAQGKALGGNWSSNAQAGSTITFVSQVGGGPNPGPVGVLAASIQAGGWGNSTTSFASDGKPVDLGAFEAVEFYAKGTGKFNMIITQPIITDWDNYGSEPFGLTEDWKLHKISLAGLAQSGWGQKKPWNPSALTGITFNVIAPPMAPIPSALYNGMVNPLIPYGIRGVLWYQGETNEGNASEYKNLLPAMIRGWRQAWGEGNFPFIYAQLPNFKAVNPGPSESAWAELREAQRLALAEPNTGMAVLIDLGEADDIHPKDKADVGNRLALASLAVAYHKPIVYSGPLFASALVKNGKMVIRFKQAGHGLVTKDGGPVTGFALAGSDRKFYWAEAKILGGDRVEVSSGQVLDPVEVRYAWADNPVCDLYNREGLPASPFRFSTEPLPETPAPAAMAR